MQPVQQLLLTGIPCTTTSFVSHEKHCCYYGICNCYNYCYLVARCFILLLWLSIDLSLSYMVKAKFLSLESPFVSPIHIGGRFHLDFNTESILIMYAWTIPVTQSSQSIHRYNTVRYAFKSITGVINFLVLNRWLILLWSLPKHITKQNSSRNKVF